MLFPDTGGPISQLVAVAVLVAVVIKGRGIDTYYVPNPTLIFTIAWRQVLLSLLYKCRN